MDVPNVLPLLLAAGASARMGKPKALLEFDGRCGLELALDAVRGLGTPIVVLGAARDDILARVPLPAARVVVNDRPERGQTSSLRLALAALPPEAEAFLIFPVDHPLVRREDVARLVDAFRGGRDPRHAVFVPSHAMRRGHPVLCRRSLAAEFAALGDNASARAVLHADPARVRHVAFDAPYVLMDMNTPAEYAELRAAWRARAAAHTDPAC